MAEPATLFTNMLDLPWMDLAARGAAAATLNVLTNVIVSILCRVFYPRFARDMDRSTGTLLRDPKKDPLASWTFVGHPFVEVALLTFALDHFGLSIAWPSQGEEKLVDHALTLATVLWMLSSFSGIFIDYTSFRMPASFVPIWWISSFLSWFYVALFTLYGRPGHGTHLHLPALDDWVGLL